MCACVTRMASGGSAASRSRAGRRSCPARADGRIPASMSTRQSPMRRRPHEAPTSPAPPNGMYSTLMCAPSLSLSPSPAPSLRRATLALYPSCPRRGETSKNRACRLAVARGLGLPAVVWTDACLCRRPRRRRCPPAPGRGRPCVVIPGRRAPVTQGRAGRGGKGAYVYALYPVPPTVAMRFTHAISAAPGHDRWTPVAPRPRRRAPPRTGTTRRPGARPRR
jgi:hypothetical protein